MTDSSELDVLVQAVRAAGPPPPDPVSLFADELAAAVDRWRAPIRVQVTGRAGVGKSAVVAALDLPADAETPALDDPDRDRDPALDADVVVYVLAATPTPADRAVLAATPGAVAVLNKADTLPGAWSAGARAADGCAAEFGVPTLPLVASLAARTRHAALTDAEASSLRRLASTADAVLTMSPELFLAVPAGTDVRARRTMLERWDLYALDCALTALRADAALTAAALTLVLHAASGVEAVADAVADRCLHAAALRGGALLDAVAELAARSLPASHNDLHTVADGGAIRAELETFLRGDLAARLGLAAGLACPDVADIAATYPTSQPGDPDDALRRADRWREVAADAATSPSGRRAARRIHQGYLRMWERMSFDARA